MANTNVNFKVNKIEKAIKAGCVVVTVQYDESGREYTFVRRNYGGSTVIDGCRIYFNESYEVQSIEREYETAGKKKVQHC